jgi:hypothetical protein
VHIFRPSLLLGEREENRRGERLGAAVAPWLNALLTGGLKKYRAIPAETVGRAMAAATLRSVRGVCVYDYETIVRLGREP